MHNEAEVGEEQEGMSNHGSQHCAAQSIAGDQEYVDDQADEKRARDDNSPGDLAVPNCQQESVRRSHEP